MIKYWGTWLILNEDFCKMVESIERIWELPLPGSVCRWRLCRDIQPLYETHLPCDGAPLSNVQTEEDTVAPNP